MFQASRVKESQNVKVPQADTGEPAKTDLPAVPKTPDAMDHMPEQMKTEYRRLKEQLAMREKTRQPLTNVNQEKGGKGGTLSASLLLASIFLQQPP